MVLLLHYHGPDEVLAEIANSTKIYTAPGPKFADDAYGSQAEIALIGLSNREIEKTTSSSGFETALLGILRVLLNSTGINLHDFQFSIGTLLTKEWLPQDAAVRPEFASLARRLAKHLENIKPVKSKSKSFMPSVTGNLIESLNSWADLLEGRKFTKSKTIIKRTKKNRPKRR